ncbi:hypothetical protein HYW35_04310 [Candidatus Saccharibacteria bacterium]|nr:hypothetical protein [Candidatus Saccharibacteria bacterium]
MGKTVAILHGWAGGKWHSKHFALALKSAGFAITDKPEIADIIIAHSAGCYNLPGNLEAKLVLLIGPPYWPNKSILRRMSKIKQHDIKHTTALRGLFYTLSKIIWQVIYIVLKPSYSWLAIRQHRHLHFLDRLKNKKILLVRNKDDYYCSREIEKVLQKYPNVHYQELPGPHDDYYTNPKPYIDLIFQELS